MDAKDRMKLTRLLWYKQITEYIIDGIKDDWLYKKLKGNFFRKQKSNGKLSNSHNSNNQISIEEFYSQNYN